MSLTTAHEAKLRHTSVRLAYYVFKCDKCPALSGVGRNKEDRPPKPKMEGGEVTRQGAGIHVRCGQFYIGGLKRILKQNVEVSWLS